MLNLIDMFYKQKQKIPHLIFESKYCNNKLKQKQKKPNTKVHSLLPCLSCCSFSACLSSSWRSPFPSTPNWALSMSGESCRSSSNKTPEYILTSQSPTFKFNIFLTSFIFNSQYIFKEVKTLFFRWIDETQNQPKQQNIIYKGLGICCVLMSATVTLYYNILIAYSVIYLLSSFLPNLPWASCNFRWNDARCCSYDEDLGNETVTCGLDTESPASQYF